LAQRRLRPRGRRGRIVGAEAVSDERALLEAARAGDEDAFARLVEPYRAQLRAHCYRMLGSLHDAEDALQETLLRAWRGLARFEGRSSFRSWLYTIATNASLRAIEQRPKRILPIDYAAAADPHGVPAEALTEPVWLEPYPDTELVSLLTDDARMTMPPQPSWYQGRDAIATFLGRFPLAPDRRFRLRPTSANGQPALAGYIWDEETSSFEAESILVLTLRDERIEEITAFRTPEVFPRFGLPERLPT